MESTSRKSDWVLMAVLVVLVGCATEPYYEAAPINPINVAPSEDVNISVNARTTFSWLATENTQFYEFHIFNQVTKDTTQYRHDKLEVESVCSEGRCSLTLNVDLPISDGHAWRVRAGNNAGLSEWNRTRFNMIEARASVSNEEPAKTSADVTVESRFESDSNPAPNAVTLSSADEQAGTSDAAAENSEAVPSAELVPKVSEVAELDTNAVVRSNTETQTLAVSNSASERGGPDLMQPTEDTQFVSGALVDFKWRSLPNAVSYDFYIYDSVSKEMVESLTDIAAVSLCPIENVCGLTREVSLPEAHHSWRVRANYEQGASPFSSNRFVVTH